MYVEVAQGFKKYFAKGFVLLLLCTLYGTKLAALQFWHALIAAMKQIKYEQSKADACLFYRQDKEKMLNIWILWVDDLLNVGENHAVQKAKKEIMKEFDCEDGGRLQEFIGCKVVVDQVAKTMQLTQPVLLQSFVDKFDHGNQKAEVPATAGTILTHQTKDLSTKKQSKF
jgi:Reverse transcriptase (RNA-dependent DNA polymerase)